MNLSQNGYIYCEIWKVIYGLPQAGIIINQQLVRRVESKGYAPCKHTPGLWRHKWRPITFSLVVYDFGIKYVGKKYAENLINTVQENDQVSSDWEGKCYCGISIKWNDQKTFLTYPCPGISKRHYTGSNTVHQQENNMLLISVNELIMEQPRNSPRQRTHRKNSPQSIS